MKPTIIRALGAVMLGAAVLGVGAGSAAAGTTSARPLPHPYDNPLSAIMDAADMAVAEWAQGGTSTPAAQGGESGTAGPRPAGDAPHTLPAPGSMASSDLRP